MDIQIDPGLAVTIAVCLLFYYYGQKIIRAAESSKYDRFTAKLKGLGFEAFWVLVRRPKIAPRVSNKGLPDIIDQDTQYKDPR